VTLSERDTERKEEGKEEQRLETKSFAIYRTIKGVRLKLS
jgi:hypothetical protein